MKLRYSLILFVSLLLVLTYCTSEEEVPEHPFKAYLSEVDSAYDYQLEKTIREENYTVYVIRMESQTWLNEEMINEALQWHWLTIVVPDEIEHNEALLWIGSGDRDDPVPEKVNPMVLNAALATNSVTADLHNVPFQPVTFLNDENMEIRVEDEIISYGWREFLENGAKDEDAIWLSRLPMTAAAQRAMDTITEFMHLQKDIAVEQYVVSGASKRGWTTWTTGIFDKRVIAIAPVVIDLLNMVPSFMHHWQAYGEWSPAIEDYENEGIMKWQFSEEYDRLVELLDPYSYKDSLEIPKYIINAASDEFFLPDSWKFYWDGLPSPKYLRYVPNAGHSMENSDAPESLIAFYNSIINNSEIPQFTWTADTTGFNIQMDPDNLPDELLLWNAHNPNARDFRLYVIDRIWLAKNIPVPEDGFVSLNIDTPSDGFTAWFVEATYDASSELPFKQTTGIVITPDIYPFEPYSPSDSLGSILTYE